MQQTVVQQPVVQQSVITEVAPVAEVEAKPALPQVFLGTTIEVGGANYGTTTGQAVLQLGDLSLPLAVQKWEADKVTVTLPLVGLAKATPATLHFFTADGQVANQLQVELLPAQQNAAPADAAPAAK